ncbi:MAG: hypothetical protein Q9227_001905 [Pyrenula ochraceoflavens]
MASSSLPSPLAPVHTPTQHSSALSIGSLLHPPTTEAYGHGSSSSYALETYAAPAVNAYSGYTYQSMDEPFMYSSTPESSQSPSSDYHSRYPHRGSISSVSSGLDMYGQAHVTPPLVSSTVPGWTPMIPPTVMPAQMLEHESSSMPSLTRTQQRAAENPLALLRGNPDQDTPEKLKAAQSFWVERETRRRILQACFVLDTLQSTLFEQSAVVGRRMPLRPTPRDSDLPFPCEDDLWEMSAVEEWAEGARASQAENLTSATNRALSDPHKVYGNFQSHLIFSHILAEAPNSAATYDKITRLYEKFRHTLGPRFSYHAILCAKNTPLRHLLAVSGESWRFGKKIENPADFRDAQAKVRQWVDSRSAAQQAVWHAIQLLRTVFVTPTIPGETNLSMLHGQWSLYIACLVCWAWGLDASRAGTRNSGRISGSISGIISPTSEPRSSSASSSKSLRQRGAHPAVLDPQMAQAEMYDYLDNMDVDGWEDMDSVEQDVSARFHGLLETVRTQKLAGSIGELLNEAERVLYRLVEGRSALATF